VSGGPISQQSFSGFIKANHNLHRTTTRKIPNILWNTKQHKPGHLNITRITPAATFKHKGNREWVWVVTDMPQGYTLSLIIFSGVATRAKRI